MALRDLEGRSSNRIGLRLDGLADCVALLINSQRASMTALQSLLNEAGRCDRLETALSESLAKAKAAEERLKRR